MGRLPKPKVPKKAELLAQLRLLQAASGQLDSMEITAQHVVPQSSAPLVELANAPVCYSNTMVKALLELRFVYFKAQFERHNSSQQLSVLWEKLLLRFNIVTSSSLNNSVTLKNKIGTLRTQYVAIRKEEQQRTGNPTDDPIQYPEYWDEMVTAFGDMNGLGDVEFGAENPNESHSPSDSYSTTSSQAQSSDENTESLKRKLEIQSEIDRQRKLRQQGKGKPNLNAGLEALGTTLAKGLVDAAALSYGNSNMGNLGDVVELLTKTKDSLERNNQIQEKIQVNLENANVIQEKSALVQEKLLSFLESKMN
jgi:hypothetical protein